jgi:hypothetical protein
MTVSVHARVTVTLEIPAGSSWGPECAMSQIKKQATENVLGKIRQATTASGGALAGAKVVGEPKVQAILAGIDE